MSRVINESCDICGASLSAEQSIMDEVMSAHKAANHTDPTVSLEARVKELEEENASLKAQITELESEAPTKKGKK